jgi:hypothetical protein
MDVQVVVDRLQQHGRTGDPAAGGPVGRVVVAVDPQDRAVVLAHTATTSTSAAPTTSA